MCIILPLLIVPPKDHTTQHSSAMVIIRMISYHSSLAYLGRLSSYYLELILTELSLIVDVASQQLQCLVNGHVQQCYTISTGANGLGEEKGSEQTPRGRHIIRAKVGAEAPLGTVFVGRRPTGEIYSEELVRAFPQRDWILTRILWLSGLEIGKNRYGTVDTLRRYIYIHGCPDDISLGSPSSHGCVRMRNADIVELFDRVVVGTKVHIVE